ncbi:MAG: M48 family metallopeptidase [Bacteroidota bacterium]
MNNLNGKKKVLYPIILLFFIISCSKVPITGRRQMNLLPESTLMSLSLTNYKTFLSENKTVSETQANTQLVKKAGNRIASAVKKYMNDNGMSKRIRNYKWEFNLVDDNTVNAWCMPGGKVVVYTGLLPVTKNETGLAVVMGHEIAHAIGRHGNERMSQQIIVQLGGIGLSVALSEKPEQTQNIFLQSYGVSATLGVLGYSRKHESEADKMGLVFMAMAGYDPHEAVAFWERMAKSGGANSPQLLSTHPSDEKRINEIKEYLTVAMTYYKKP